MNDKESGINQHPVTRWITDSHFWFAMMLGPVVWLLLHTQLQTTQGEALDYRLLLYVCLLYPVLEELAFRGFIQGLLLERKFGSYRPGFGISVANLLTSVVFALAHLVSQPPLWSFAVFFPSLVFGYFRDRTDAVLPSIVLHCWYNIGFFLLVR